MMKRLIIAFCAISIMACKEEVKIDYAILSGKVENTKMAKATLSNAEFKTEIDINSDGTFKDTLHIPENGFYSLSIGREYTPMYLSTGDDIVITLDAKKFDETISYSGEGSIENNYLAAKTLNNIETTKNAVNFYSAEEQDFKMQLDSIIGKNEALLNGLTNADETFVSTEKQNLVYDRYAMLNNYSQRHGYYTKNDGFEVSNDFFPEDMKSMTFDNADAYKSSESYKRMAFDDVLSTIFEEIEDPSEATVENLKVVDKIKIDALKNDVIDYLSSFLVSPANENMESIYTFFKDNSSNEDTKKKLNTIFEKNKNLVKGKPSPQFSNYENHKGGTTSLSDLKGKYVYVDVWATWCGPCIREIPSLKEVEKTFHNENIEFVSTSIDELKDHEKWKTMVNDKELGGMQLMADNAWQSEFVKDYGIDGIPRFILIDPEGNIVSADAPRPSNPKLVELLEKELKL